MLYLVSDIHGCFDELQILLNMVNFSDKKDELIILGDIVDRGPKIIETYEWVRARFGKNVKMIMGNHEYDFLIDVYLMYGEMLSGQIPENEIQKKCITYYETYGRMNDEYGTVQLILKEKPIEYLLEMAQFFEALPFYIELMDEKKNRKTILVHAYTNDDPKETPLIDIIWKRDFAKHERCHIRGHVVYGHTPTNLIKQNGKSGEASILMGFNWSKINIDCGCVYGGNLCLYDIMGNKFYYAECVSNSK